MKEQNFDYKELEGKSFPMDNIGLYEVADQEQIGKTEYVNIVHTRLALIDRKRKKASILESPKNKRGKVIDFQFSDKEYESHTQVDNDKYQMSRMSEFRWNDMLGKIGYKGLLNKETIDSISERFPALFKYVDAIMYHAKNSNKIEIGSAELLALAEAVREESIKMASKSSFRKHKLNIKKEDLVKS